MTNDPTPDETFATDVVRRLTAAGHTALFAGGCVRDLVLGKLPKDYDVATDARPEQVRDLFGRRRTLAVGESFGVIIVLPPRKSGAQQVEVATFRTEGPYLDGRRPEAVSFATPEEDASRRDFTINGMFYDPLAKQARDYVGGQRDIKRAVVRAIGDPHERMTEDKLRLLRAVRFAATLEFELEHETGEAIRRMAVDLTMVSAERIGEELKRMLADQHRRRAVLLLADTQLWPVIFPELRDLPRLEEQRWERMTAALALLETDRFEPALAIIAAEMFDAIDPASVRFPEHKPEGLDEVHDLCRRLRLSNEETDRVCWLAARLPSIAAFNRLSLPQKKRLLAHADAPLLLQTAEAVMAANSDDHEPIRLATEILARGEHELKPPPLLSGKDLIDLGLRPGPQFKAILDDVRDQQLAEEIATPEAALIEARYRIDAIE
ncbi:CCA tRNA nucleotidyltransferase [Stratiformator vulcanicus]|uniref:tRNA nucleotidyltransferase/poly(A) polymerase n=1 Tax=Stratiformator vulcanicus TaxID=2527980 RepID=A0A517R6N5_9PLAN|nr:CCA tRNA nucleotidyltransferase [Stratiformator vulcanicus]QDT39549.1 tRNA nucleotidyltransferase/poly(A) polymerase [Stratiformator vulcanicus]